MQAILNGHKVAASDDIVETGGYAYFPRETVRMEWLESPQNRIRSAMPARRADLRRRDRWRAPQAQRLVVQAPQPKMAQVANRFGFWEDVQVG